MILVSCTQVLLLIYFDRECYLTSFVPKCLGCKQIIVDTYIQALGGHYHKDCFVCQVMLIRLNIGRDQLSI